MFERWHDTVIITTGTYYGFLVWVFIATHFKTSLFDKLPNKFTSSILHHHGWVCIIRAHEAAERSSRRVDDAWIFEWFFSHTHVEVVFLSVELKGVQGSECVTGRRLVSPAVGHPNFFWNSLYFGLRATQNIHLSILGYINNLVVASNVIQAYYRAIKAI